MPFSIVRNDITKMDVDVIVNAANTGLKRGGGVCGAIFSAAGPEELKQECEIIGKCDVGKAVITKGYNLSAKYIIHAVGPLWQGGNQKEAILLYDAYKNSLFLAKENNLSSIAFPLISSGIYGYPKAEALSIAIKAIGDFLLEHEMMVYLVVYDKESFVLTEKLSLDIESYIDENYIEESYILNRQLRSNLPAYSYDSVHIEESSVSEKKRSLENVLSNVDDSFPEMLLRLIDEKKMTDVETYKKANIDRKLFSKIRSNNDYKPSKVTAIAFAIALELSLDETIDLLARAGYTLSHSSKSDLIIEFFIEEENYNIFEINEALFAFDQPLLGF